MTVRIWLRIGLALWALCVIASFWGAARTAPADFGLTAGLNRIGVFLEWQLAAAIVAVMVWIIGNRLKKGSSSRIINRVPLGVFAVLVAAILGLILWGNLSKPAPQTTAPIAPVATTKT